MDQPEISVIIPFLNEEENLPDLIAELEAFAPTMPVRMEVVFVDDGSTDGSLDLLRKARFRISAHRLQTFTELRFSSGGSSRFPECRRPQLRLARCRFTRTIGDYPTRI
jgi:GT2 family glycosyltransferase